MTNNARHTFTIDHDLAHRIHKLAESQIKTTHNHIASYVEREEFDEAKKLTDELRALRIIFATFNVETKATTCPEVTNHEQHPVW